MNKRSLILVNALLWAFAAYKILGKGLPALRNDLSAWIIVLCVLIAAGFLAMFARVSGRYTQRILDMEGERFPIWKFMSPKGYLVIGIMMTMGIVLGLIPSIPQEFFAFFYPGLGSGLAFGAARYLVAAMKA